MAGASGLFERERRRPASLRSQALVFSNLAIRDRAGTQSYQKVTVVVVAVADAEDQ